MSLNDLFMMKMSQQDIRMIGMILGGGFLFGGLGGWLVAWIYTSYLDRKEREEDKKRRFKPDA